MQLRLFQTKMLRGPTTKYFCGPQVENHWFKGWVMCDNWTLKTGNKLKTLFSKLDFQKLTKILINQCYFRSTKMLAQLADLRLCALYVLGLLCPSALMSAPLRCPASFCLRPYVVDRQKRYANWAQSRDLPRTLIFRLHKHDAFYRSSVPHLTRDTEKSDWL